MARIAGPDGRRTLLCPAAALALLAAHSANAQAHRATSGGSVVIEEAIGSLTLYTTKRTLSAHSIAELRSEAALFPWPDFGDPSRASHLSEPDPDLGQAVVVSRDMVSVGISPISAAGPATISSTLGTKLLIGAEWQPPHRYRRTVLILAKFN